MSTLSVVLPTLNCMKMLPAHLKTMRSWLSLVDEIVVVDSHSNDGTSEYLRENLSHPNVKFHSRPRGLYQSWNFGIEQTTGEWVYISTVGDRITADLLRHLLETGETLRCDVVASRPNFVDENDRPVSPTPWPIDLILKAARGRTPVRLVGPETYLYALLAIPCALLGSSASNVYRGAHLRARPFPTEFGTTGDTAWSLRYGLETAYGFTASRGSWFRLHAKAYTKQEYQVDDLCAKFARLALETLQRGEHSPQVVAKIQQLQLVTAAAKIAGNSRRDTAAVTAA